MSGLQQFGDLLATIPLFARWHSSDLRVVAKRCDLREVSAGTALIRAGAVGDASFVLLSGRPSVVNPVIRFGHSGRRLLR